MVRRLRGHGLAYHGFFGCVYVPAHIKKESGRRENGAKGEVIVGRRRI